MAEIVVGVIAEGILNKALSFASDEISYLWGFKEETQRLANKMQMMQALLTDAENKQLIKSAAVQLWLKRLQDVALDADNVLDELAYEGVRQKIEVKNSKRSKVRNFFSSSNPLAFRHKMATVIKKVNLLLDELYQEANGIGLIAVALVNSSVELNEILQTGPFVDDSEIVGRDHDISSIVASLVNSNNGEGLPVISIVGMPGQGKTTVAQLVYKNDKVVSHFDYRLWVCVSDNFNVDMVLNEMVESVTHTRSDMTNREAIMKKLQGKVSNKRFFLVLDDVWNENRVNRDSMKKTLLEIGGSIGSKIMVTTRSENVSLAMEAYMTHHLGTLSSEESWTLFKQVAFADGGARETPEVVSLGKRMLKRCGGVPLAVKALGGLLYARKYEKEWFTIERSELWGSTEDPVLPSLRLSYNHLPLSSLKQCFGFCSLFQKDSIIEKEKLIQLWMAQGYLNCSKENHLEMEGTGGNYSNILLRNSLLQVDKQDEYGNVSTYKMHDLVHDLALDVSKNHCLMKDIEEVNEEIKVVNLSLVSGEKILLEIPIEHSQRMRTLFFGGILLGDTLIRFQRLHILILNCKDVTEFPSSVRKLKHLRYLDVSETKIVGVADAILKLYSLQTLRLHSLENFPKEFGNLINLRHFYIEKFEISDNNQVKCLLPGIGQLTFLQTLPYFVVSQEEGCQIYELQGLSKLRGSLKIYGLEKIENGEDAKKAKIEDKTNIHNLEYHWRTIREELHHNEVNDVDILEGLKPNSNIRGIKLAGFCGSRFPSWIMEPSCSYLLRNLVKFVMDSCNMCEQIPPLGCLPCLKIVQIDGMDSITNIRDEFYGLSYLVCARTTNDVITAFPALKHLSVRNLRNLVGWFDIQEIRWSVLPVEVFPLLEELTISGCDMLQCLPDMRSLRSLRKLSISFCRALIFLPNELGFLESLEEIGIFGCHSLIEFPDIHGLRRLRLLSIEECQLNYLPLGLQSLNLLQDLNIGGLPDLVEIPDLRNLTSLRCLGIRNCQKLRSLPSGLEYCTSLDYVEICSCPFFHLEGLHLLPILRRLSIGLFSDDLDYFPWMDCEIPQGVTETEGNVDAKLVSASLVSVTLLGWPKLTSLPEQLQFYPLTYLSIGEFKGLVALPDWFGNMKSLQTLSIWDCENLMYFPSAVKMRSLNNLQKVVIEKCPLLENRCLPRTGPEWHKIAHIPEISIKNIWSI